ncbi:hypothetical protein ACFQ4O_08905 [Methylopila musalis]|uniref:Alpha/beta hydrolase family protein n=1 Tax=Methylopila musalis TaxID=1134781 RepID=A0ABW3Z7S8_9HYPH
MAAPDDDARATPENDAPKTDQPKSVRFMAGRVDVELWPRPASASGRFCIVARPHSMVRWKAVQTLRCPVAVCNTVLLSKLPLTSDETAADLIAHIEGLRDAREIVFVGDSGGGYTAFAVGVALARQLPNRPVRAIAFNPPTQIWPPEDTRNHKSYLGLVERASRQPGLLERLEAEGDLTSWLRAGADTPGSDFRGLIVASALQRHDIRHAERMIGQPGVSVVSFPNAQHSAFFWWLVMAPDASEAEIRDRIWHRIPSKFTAGQDPAALRNVPEHQERVEREFQAFRLFRKTLPTLASMLDWLNAGRGDRRFELSDLEEPAPEAAESASRTS